jgi:hypothetical protein
VGIRGAEWTEGVPEQVRLVDGEVDVGLADGPHPLDEGPVPVALDDPEGGLDQLVEQLATAVGFAILLDATVMRGLLVPALIRVMGRANWWSPRPLARVYERFALREG